MKLPKIINPDRIKDSIVEVKFLSEFPFEVCIGLIFQSLDDSYKYTNRPTFGQKNNSQTDGASEIKLEFGFPQSIFFNDKIKIEIQPNSIIFNCIDKYLTWGLYKPEITRVLDQIFKSNVITSFNRVGVRYISEYPDRDIKEITKFDFSFGMPDVLSDNYAFRSEYKKSDCRIIINLKGKYPMLNNDSTKKIISSIDVDVIKESLSVNNLTNLYDVIEELHTMEKTTFFSLLKEEFLTSLNPKY